MSIFEELERKAQENRERWEAIDDLISNIKDALSEESSETRTDKLVEMNTAMLLLLAEQLRPMSDTSLQSNFKDMFGDLMKHTMGKGGK